MSRKKTPELEKAKQSIKTLTDDDLDTLEEWFELLLEVREAEKERKMKALTV